MLRQISAVLLLLTICAPLFGQSEGDQQINGNTGVLERYDGRRDNRSNLIH